MKFIFNFSRILPPANPGQRVLSQTVVICIPRHLRPGEWSHLGAARPAPGRGDKEIPAAQNIQPQAACV